MLSAETNLLWLALVCTVPATFLGVLGVGFARRYSNRLCRAFGLEPAPGKASIRLNGAAALCLSSCAMVFADRHGLSLATLCLMAATVLLLVLALVDAASWLLPDALTLPLLWLGLALALAGGPLPLHDAVAGAMAGYVSLWLLFRVYGYFRKRQGMGYGDFKLLAALGAWVGPAGLPWVLLAACVVGLMLSCLANKRFELTDSYPFGPFLATSGMGVMLLAPELNSYF